MYNVFIFEWQIYFFIKHYINLIIMISGVCAAEFDLIKGFLIHILLIGCVITGIYPSTDINENLLSSYMIPDGVHKIT